MVIGILTFDAILILLMFIFRKKNITSRTDQEEETLKKDLGS